MSAINSSKKAGDYMPKVKFEGKIGRRTEDLYYVAIPSVIARAFEVQSGDNAIVVLLDDDESLIDIDIEKENK